MKPKARVNIKVPSLLGHQTTMSSTSGDERLASDVTEQSEESDSSCASMNTLSERLTCGKVGHMVLKKKIISRSGRFAVSRSHPSASTTLLAFTLLIFVVAAELSVSDAYWW